MAPVPSLTGLRHMRALRAPLSLKDPVNWLNSSLRYTWHGGNKHASSERGNSNNNSSGNNIKRSQEGRALEGRVRRRPSGLLARRPAVGAVRP